MKEFIKNIIISWLLLPYNYYITTYKLIKAERTTKISCISQAINIGLVILFFIIDIAYYMCVMLLLLTVIILILMFMYVFAEYITILLSVALFLFIIIYIIRRIKNKLFNK